MTQIPNYYCDGNIGGINTKDFDLPTPEEMFKQPEIKYVYLVSPINWQYDDNNYENQGPGQPKVAYDTEEAAKKEAERLTLADLPWDDFYCFVHAEYKETRVKRIIDKLPQLIQELLEDEYKSDCSKLSTADKLTLLKVFDLEYYTVLKVEKRS